MATKIFRIPALIFIGLIFTFSQCKKNCTETEHTFSMKVEAYPDKTNIHLGDTIWLELNESTTFTDNTTLKKIDYIMAKNLGFGLSFDKLTEGDVSNPGAEFAAKSFSIRLIEGEELESLLPSRIKSFNFKEEREEYRFKIGIIPNEVGTFAVSISNAANVYRKYDKCTKASFRIVFANTDQHLNLYQEKRPGYQITEYERTHMYCFNVY